MPSNNNRQKVSSAGYSLRIRAAREKLGLSQKGAAAAWGFAYETLSSWEQAERNPAGLYREKLEKILRRAEGSQRGTSPASIS